MGSSYIEIDSITIDLASSIGKRDAGKCEHFSIREYVSEVRKKDWKLCWPFPIDESEKQPSFPPLDVPKHRCPNSQKENAAQDIPKDNQADYNRCITGCRSDTNCSNAALKPCIQKDPMSSIIVRRDIDLNTKLSGFDGCLPISIEKEKKVGVELSRRIDLEIGLEDNLNHQAESVPSPKVYPGYAQEVHTTERGCESNGVSNVQFANNFTYTDKNSAEICYGGTPSADNQCQKESVATAVETDNKCDHTTGPPIESFACNQEVPAGSTDNMVEDDFQDSHSEKSMGVSRRRPRKVRLMTDLLRENAESKTDKTAIQESPFYGTSNTSAASQARSIFPGKVDFQGDMTLTNMGLSRKRKIVLDEVRSTETMHFQRDGFEAQNLEGNAKTTVTIFNKKSNSKGVLAGTGLQVSEKGNWSKSEHERSHIMGKKKNKKNQVVENFLTPEPQGQRRQNEDTVYTTDKSYGSKTVSSRLTPSVFTKKGMDSFPFHTLRIENEFQPSKEKGKMLQTDEELNSFSSHRNDMLVRDSFAYSGVKIRSSVPADVPIPSVEGAMNGKGLEEGLHLSLNNHMSEHGYNKKCIHQIENRLPFSSSFQESTSKVPNLNRKDSETNVFGGPSIPFRHTTNTISGKGNHYEEITGARNTGKTVEAAEQLGINKTYNEQAAEVSEQGTLDDIPMEIVELMAKNQYERCLPDVENRGSIFEKSSISRNALMTSGNAVYGKGKMSLSKEGQKQKPKGRPKKNNTVTRGENVKPCKRKPNHYFSPFNGSNLGVNNPYPPQPSFGFEVPQSQKKLSNEFQFSPMISNQLGSARNIKFNGNLEERTPSNATLQALGGCSLHKNILQQDNEASRIWASLASNRTSLGYDVSHKAASQPSSSNMDITSLRSGAVHTQNLRRDIDLNYTNINATGQEKHSRNTGAGVFSRLNGEYSYPCKHNGIEPHQNLRGSLDLYSNETIPAMHLLSLMDAGMQSRTPFNVGVNAQMLNRPSYPGDCNTKMDISTSKTNGTLKRQSSDYYNRSYLSDKQHGCLIGSQTFGASSSAQQGKKFAKDAGSNGQNSNSQNSTKFGKKEKMRSSNAPLPNRFLKQCNLSYNETKTSQQHRFEVHGTHTSVPLKITPGISCTVNRNPAEFTVPETGNVYMIRGEDLKFFNSIPKNKHFFPIPCGHKQQRSLKETKMKEHSQH
ncbi:protein EMBRYONIC FLOWER 1 [Vicia villosa]|uniref:protein EMBRYONIC FLOWER 1 n=1 Tax=Vicia villosa TaxID=3911 RepID=UPI00273C2C7A|nr:protein EMBRYONIC FLOWER 1 [Vicia villosa]